MRVFQGRFLEGFLGGFRGRSWGRFEGVFNSFLNALYEKKRDENLQEMERQTDEMRQMFVQRVKEKEGELKEAEKEVS